MLISLTNNNQFDVLHARAMFTGGGADVATSVRHDKIADGQRVIAADSCTSCR